MLKLNQNVSRADSTDLGFRWSPTQPGHANPHFGVLTPSHHVAPELAIAAARAGELGLANLGWGGDVTNELRLVAELAAQVEEERHFWGVRVGGCHSEETLNRLVELALPSCPVIVISGGEGLEERLGQARRVGDQVWAEVCSREEALAAEAAGCDAVILKGEEAGGRVGNTSTYLLLQQLYGQLQTPFWVQGGIGPETATAAFLAGASGVILSEQLWATRESPFEGSTLDSWKRHDGSETQCLEDGQLRVRLHKTPANRQLLNDLERKVAAGASLAELLRECGESDQADLIVPLGQEIAFASSLCEGHASVAGVLGEFRRRIDANLASAQASPPLAPQSSLAQDLGIEFPILQGPMTRVSDVSKFADAVSATGAFPFLALALMRGPEIRKLLQETSQQLGERPWGVGILGFVPPDLRKEQLREVLDAKPPMAIIAGGRPSQSRELEEHGIRSFLHVPSPGLLELFIRDGGRRFIFEGRECGGHVGPRSSFILWQSAIDVLLATEIEDPSEISIVFAGGVHDAMSAAMVSAMAAPLAERGMKIGVLLGTAYLFTEEAVNSGAITQEFQDQAIRCRHTALLESGLGHATRCVESPFADEFRDTKDQMLRDGKDSDEMRYELEMLSIGRLRLASKGVIRRSSAEAGAKSEIVPAEVEEQKQRGMYMIGDLATLRDQPTTMSELHDEVSRVGSECLQELASTGPRWSTRTQAETEDIAIVGISCVFPNATNPRQYWGNIINQVNAIQEVPKHRWDINQYFAEDRFEPDRVYSRWGGFIDDFVFDPIKWRIPPASMKSIDTIQLYALDVAAKCFADAGYQERDFPRDRTGCIFAIAGSHDVGTDYCFRTMMRHYLPRATSLDAETREQVFAELEADLPVWTEDSFPGFLLNVVAGRIANRFDLGGPNYVVDAACAASFAALHAAVDKLRLGVADMMMVGAADASNNPFCYMSFAKTHALSPRGRSRPFDDTADGIALGEGVVAVLLKRLSDAERDGDRIYAVIKGIGGSSDGSSRSLTAPHTGGQIVAMQRAYADANVDPATVSLFEAHGTGTAVGDQTEAQSLEQLLRASAAPQHGTALGSVKSMIGHTKTAAGLASLVKTVLALKHRVLPPTLGVETPNSKVDFASSPLYINSEARPWVSAHGHPRRGGVSAFGFGGTNFHVVLEEYAEALCDSDEVDLRPTRDEIFVWRAASREALIARVQSLASQLRSTDFDELAALSQAVCYESSRVQDNDVRLSIVANTMDDLRAKLDQVMKRLPGGEDAFVEPSGIYFAATVPVTTEQVCFLYPGQGSQRVNMLNEVAMSHRSALGWLEAANERLRDELPKPLSTYIYPPPPLGAIDFGQQQEELNDTRVAQPALAATEIFATQLLADFDIHPGMLAGHSFGELTALWAAGCLQTDDFLDLAAFRGRISADACREGSGAMATVTASAAETRQLLQELGNPVYLANDNAPNQTTIAGESQALEDTIAALTKKSLSVRKLPVTAAFHTPVLKAAGDALATRLGQLEISSPARKVFSNTTGAIYPPTSDKIKALLKRHLQEPVQFAAEIQAMYDAGGRVFIEVGPGRVLSGLVRRNLAEQPHTCLSLEDRDGASRIPHLLGHLASLGLSVKLSRWFYGRGYVRKNVEQVLAEYHDAQAIKRTDWVVSTSGSRPAAEASRVADDKPAPTDSTASAKVPSPEIAKAVSPEIAKAPPIQPTTSSLGPPIPIARQRTREAAANAPAKQLTPEEVNPASSVNTPPHHATTVSTNQLRSQEQDLIGSHQERIPMSQHSNHPDSAGSDMVNAYMRTVYDWLETQKRQQATFERVLNVQEQLLLHGTVNQLPPTTVHVTDQSPTIEQPRAIVTAPAQPPVTTPPAMTTPSAVAAVAPVAAQPPAPTAVVAGGNATAPIPVPMSNEVLQPTKTAGFDVPNPTPAVQVETVPPSNPSSTELSVPSATAGPPSTAQFREDLLAAVSEKTGYPIDMLDVDLPMESGLGIDSIKTVEVFSILKEYHQYFRLPDQDEEEQLAEFTRLKTLGDIIDGYEERMQQWLPESGTAALPAPTGGNGSGGQVQRMTLQAERAQEGADEKKKTSPVTS